VRRVDVTRPPDGTRNASTVVSSSNVGGVRSRGGEDAIGHSARGWLFDGGTAEGVDDSPSRPNSFARGRAGFEQAIAEEQHGCAWGQTTGHGCQRAVFSSPATGPVERISSTIPSRPAIIGRQWPALVMVSRPSSRRCPMTMEAKQFPGSSGWRNKCSRCMVVEGSQSGHSARGDAMLQFLLDHGHDDGGRESLSRHVAEGEPEPIAVPVREVEVAGEGSGRL